MQRQIEQLGQSLAKALSDIYRLKNDGKIEDEIETIVRELGEKLNFNIPELVKISDSEFMERLRENNGFDDDNLERLADFLFILAESQDRKTGWLYYGKSLTIYEYIERKEKMYSFERRAKIKTITAILTDRDGG